MACGQSGSKPTTTAVSDTFFPFVLPWNDGVTGTATDLSFLNVKPAGKNGRIEARNGHFYEQKTGSRVRFFGTNLVTSAAFPAKTDADAIAARLAKLGVNIVRFHHLQNDWDLPNGTIWKRDKMQLELDPAALDRMDFFISRLRAHGIYINLNLQTTRKPIPEQGLPASSTQLKDYGKKADKYYERLIVLQQEYAKALLDRTNPYTKLKYKDDPALMVIEINNENSLVGWPGESPGAGVPGFPEPFRGELVRQWNAWLKEKYQNNATLAQNWPNLDRRGASVVNAKSQWTFENQSKGDVTFTPAPESGSQMTAPDLVASVNNNPGPAWHVQTHIGGLTLKEGQPYTVEFTARGDRNTAFSVDARLDQPDWRFLGLSGSVSVTPEWKTYTLTFRPVGTVPGHGRVGFTMGDTRGKVEIKNFSIREGEKIEGLQPGETIGNIDLPSAGLNQRSQDYVMFLAETERKFSTRMRRYLTDDLGFRNTNIIDSQISWGSLTSLYREEEMEFADNHAYWNHPAFLKGDWSPTDYRVDRKPLVNELEHGGGTLADLAVFRVANKPYSISEYNHPAPSDFQAEMMPLYSTFAAFQDWDIIYTFAWDATGTGVKNDAYDNYFDSGKNPAKAALFPAAALIFRQGLVPPSNVSALLTVSFPYWGTYYRPTDAWSGTGKPLPFLTHRVGVQAGKENKIVVENRPSATPITLRGTPGQRFVVSRTEKSVSITGFVGGQEISADPVQVKFGKFGFNFGTLMVTPVDSKPIFESKRILVSSLSRVENTNMQWNAARDSVSDKWGTGPTRFEFVPATIRVATNGPRKVYALDATGKRRTLLKSSWTKRQTVFTTTVSDKTCWYEIADK
jgi:hypothetical protein